MDPCGATGFWSGVPDKNKSWHLVGGEHDKWNQVNGIVCIIHFAVNIPKLFET